MPYTHGRLHRFRNRSGSRDLRSCSSTCTSAPTPAAACDRTADRAAGSQLLRIRQWQRDGDRSAYLLNGTVFDEWLRVAARSSSVRSSNRPATARGSDYSGSNHRSGKSPSSLLTTQAAPSSRALVRPHQPPPGVDRAISCLLVDHALGEGGCPSRPRSSRRTARRASSAVPVAIGVPQQTRCAQRRAQPGLQLTDFGRQVARRGGAAVQGARARQESAARGAVCRARRGDGGAPRAALRGHEDDGRRGAGRAGKLRVEVSHGARGRSSFDDDVDLLVCTFERANGIINRQLEAPEGLGIVGALVIDEVHMVNDPSRGFLIEQILTKVKAHGRTLASAAAAARVSSAAAPPGRRGGALTGESATASVGRGGGRRWSSCPRRWAIQRCYGAGSTRSL